MTHSELVKGKSEDEIMRDLEREQVRKYGIEHDRIGHDKHYEERDGREFCDILNLGCKLASYLTDYVKDNDYEFVDEDLFDYDPPYSNACKRYEYFFRKGMFYEMALASLIDKDLLNDLEQFYKAVTQNYDRICHTIQPYVRDMLFGKEGNNAK